MTLPTNFGPYLERIVAGSLISGPEQFIFRGLLQEGFSGNAAIREMSARGMGIRRQSGLALAREFRNQAERENRMANIRKEFRPSGQFIREIQSRDMKAEFGYTTRLKIRDAFGNENDSWQRFNSDRLLTMQEQEDEARRIFAKGGGMGRDDFGGSVGGEVIEFRFIDVRRQVV